MIIFTEQQIILLSLFFGFVGFWHGAMWAITFGTRGLWSYKRKKGTTGASKQEDIDERTLFQKYGKGKVIFYTLLFGIIMGTLVAIWSYYFFSQTQEIEPSYSLRYNNYVNSFERGLFIFGWIFPIICVYSFIHDVITNNTAGHKTTTPKAQARARARKRVGRLERAFEVLRLHGQLECNHILTELGGAAASPVGGFLAFFLAYYMDPVRSD
jgi:hypothetical protein